MDMPKIRTTDLRAIERAPTSPAALSQGVWEVLSHSVAVKAKVDSYNYETGEYRVVLQGTLDQLDTKFEKS